jgi:hypothetical protein
MSSTVTTLVASTVTPARRSTRAVWRALTPRPMLLAPDGLGTSR